MPRNPVITAAPLSDSIQDVEMNIRIRPVGSDPETGDPLEETVAQRLQFRARYRVLYDAVYHNSEMSEWADINDGNIDTFSAGNSSSLRSLLVKLYNDGKTKLNLDD